MIHLSNVINFTELKKVFVIKWNNFLFRHFGVTHMEPSYARSVFPCFDEPHFKTPYIIEIAREKHLKTVSNMHLLKTTLPEWVSF